MNKLILAIYDGEERYAHGLMEYLCDKEDFPFQVHVYTDQSCFLKALDQLEIECLLVSENVYSNTIDNLLIPHIIILSESENNLCSSYHHINKYQSCEAIYKEILSYYADKAEVMGRVFRSSSNRMKIIGVYSPLGRCLQTTFAFTLGEILSKKSKTLYLNFERYSGFSTLFRRSYEQDMSDLMYYFECAREKLSYRLSTLVETVNGLDYIPPVEMWDNLNGIKGKQWVELFAEIEKHSDYEYLILDLSDHIWDLWEILKYCSVVLTIHKSDGLSVAKINQYEKILEMTGNNEILTKTKRMTLPVFKQIPANFAELTYGDLARYIKEEILPEIGEIS